MTPDYILDYWIEAVESALEDVNSKDEFSTSEIKTMAESMLISHDNHGLATGHDLLTHNPKKTILTRPVTSKVSKEEINTRVERYAKWRKEHNFPQFEPPNGICWNCKKQIFEICDGTKSITCCPYCHISYC